MATDRMFLVDTTTGMAFVLAKRMATWISKSSELQKFLDICFEEGLKRGGGGYTVFEIWYESEEGFRYTGKEIGGYPLVMKIAGYIDSEKEELL